MLDFPNQNSYRFGAICLRIDAPEILPYFVRAKLNELLAQGQGLDGCLDDQGDVWEMLELPFEEFADRVEHGWLPKDFYVTDRLTDSLLQNTRCQVLPNTHSVAGPVLRQVPPITSYSCFDWWDDGNVLVYVFKYQPSVFNADAGKRDAEKYLAEAKEFLVEAGVEVPEDFPFWKVIGVLFESNRAN